MRLKSAIVGTLLLFAAGTAGTAFSQELPPKTALDDYVNKPDDTYRWKVISSNSAEGLNQVVIDMVSQTWRSPEEVDRTQWQHWMTVAYPDKVRSNIGFLYIGSGRNGGDPPSGPNDRVKSLAKATGTVVAELHMVPNQPLVFFNDGRKRSEDDLIAYTWEKFLETGEAGWLARNAMIKSAVRAMDTMTAYMASEAGGGQTVDKFVVAGASKRGWTTWLTGAIDDRVVAIAPIVIDVLNVHVSMMHHFKAYGFWAPAVGDYVEHRIMHRMNHPRMAELYQLVDPLYYRHRLTMPKFVLNAAGDQFFLPDSSKFYWEDLEGDKYLRYVPNADHSLRNSDGLESVIAFYSLIVTGKPIPKVTWFKVTDGELEVKTDQKPKEVRLWQATNPVARDFRLETLGPKYTSTELEVNGNGEYVINVKKPEKGWRAYFVEFTYDVGAALPLKLTTEVCVIPDILPFKEKDPTLPTSITLVCEAANEAAAQEVLKALAEADKFSKSGLQTKQIGSTLYVNWVPRENEFEVTAKLLTPWLAGRGCDHFRYQLESGTDITTNPE